MGSCAQSLPCRTRSARGATACSARHAGCRARRFSVYVWAQVPAGFRKSSALADPPSIPLRICLNWLAWFGGREGGCGLRHLYLAVDALPAVWPCAALGMRGAGRGGGLVGVGVCGWVP